MSGILLLVVSWWRDPALVLYFMVVVPVWAIVGLAISVVLVVRQASPLVLLLPISAIGGCWPAARAHLHWYGDQAEQTFLEFMAAEAEGRTDARVTTGRALTRLTEEDRRRVAQEIVSHQCSITHRDEFFGAQEITVRCFDTLDVLADLSEGPLNRWRFDVYFVGTNGVVR